MVVDHEAALTRPTGRLARLLPKLTVCCEGDRIKARVNDCSPHPTAPVLHGRLRPRDGGTEIEGTLSWALLKGWQVTLVGGACVLIVVGLVTAQAASVAETGGFLLSGLGLAGLAWWDWLTEAATRRTDEEALRAGLLEWWAAQRAPGETGARPSPRERWD